MPRADDFEDLKTRYKCLIQKNEREPIPQHGDDKTWPINSAALAVLVVGARICRHLVDLGVILAVVAREVGWLRRMTQGEIEKVLAEQRRRGPEIVIPGRG